VSAQHVVIIDADGNPPQPVPYTLTADPPEGGPWYAMPELQPTADRADEEAAE
jgi:hypothetical protein